MKHLFIINPVAGGTDKTETVSRLIHSAMDRRLNEPYEIYVTKGPMDACAAIKKRALDGAEMRVYACGGDGTLNECVNGAAGLPNVALTHYPMGTGNDFCRIFGTGAELFNSFENLLDGVESKIDLIDCNGRYSINICSVGIDARIGTDVHKYSRLPFISGRRAYIFSTLVNFIKGIGRSLTVRLDGTALKGEFSLICACNGRYYGGGFNPIPDAEPDDGQLDFLIVRKVPRLTFAKLIGKYKSGRYKDLPRDIVTYHRGPYLRVESAEKMVINIDGEMQESKVADFRVAPSALRFFFPRGTHW
jgi:diacylglycerol kinase (ATP)